MNNIKIVVSVIIALLCIVFLLVFLINVPTASSKQDVAICAQNALYDLASGIQRTADDNVIFKCPITKVTFTSADLNRKTQTIATRYGLSEKQYNYENFLWNQVNDCYAKVNYGYSPYILGLFERNAQIVGRTNVCVICSDIIVAENTKEATSSLQNSGKVLLEKETDGRTLLEKVKSTSDVNLIFQTKSNLDSTQRNYAVYFITTQEGWYSKLRQAFVSATGIPSTFEEMFDPNAVDVWKGFHSVAITTESTIKNNCDWIVNDYAEAP